MVDTGQLLLVFGPPARGRKLKRDPEWVPQRAYFALRRTRLLELQAELAAIDVVVYAMTRTGELEYGGFLRHPETEVEVSFIAQREETREGVRHYDAGSMLARVHVLGEQYARRVRPEATRVAEIIAQVEQVLAETRSDEE